MVGSDDSYYPSFENGETAADSVDELEAETSFTTFTPMDDFMDPMHESLSDSPSATTSADTNCKGASFMRVAWERNKETKSENRLKAKKTR